MEQEAPSFDYILQKLQQVEDLVRSHKHTGYDLSQKLRSTTISQVNIVNTSTLGDGVATSGTLTMRLAPNQGDVFIRAVIDAGDFDNVGLKTGFIFGLDDSDLAKAKFFFGSPTAYVKYDGATLSIAGTLTAGSINIPNTTTASSFHTDSSGNSWWGANIASGLANANASITAAGLATFKNILVTGGSITGSGIVAVQALNLANRGWTQTSIFTFSSATVVAWGAGTFLSADGTTTYSISAGNTGTMAAKTYIYLDALVSTTVYQTTTTAATAVGAGKVLIAVAQNAVGEATFTVLEGQGGQNIDAANIVANSITANELSTSITYAGQIIVSTSGAIRSGQTAYNTGTGWWIGSDVGTAKFSIGSPTGSRVTWDGTDLTIVGTQKVSALYTAVESISTGQACAVGLYTSNGGILYDTIASGTFSYTAVSVGGTYTTPTFAVANQTNRVMVIFLKNSYAGSGTALDGTQTASFNGSAATYLSTVSDASDSGNRESADLFILAAPAITTAGIAFTGLSSVANGSYSWVAYVAYNCKQTSIPHTSVIGSASRSNTGVGTNLSISVTSTVDGCLTVGRGGDQTLYHASLDGGDTGIMIPKGIYTMTKVVGVGNVTTGALVALEPVTAPTAAVVKASAKAPNVTDYWATSAYKSRSFIGFANEALTAGNIGAVVISGEATGLSSITMGEQYYLSDTYGSIQLTAGTNTRKVAIGTSTSKVLITNIW